MSNHMGELLGVWPASSFVSSEARYQGVLFERGLGMLRRLIATAALLVAACESAPVGVIPAAVQSTMAETFTTPEWAEKTPSAEDILRLYPAEALRQSVEGVAYLNCTVTGSYYLDCVEGTETPSGYGFGPAALELSRIYRVTKNHPGAEPGTEIRLPVRFKTE